MRWCRVCFRNTRMLLASDSSHTHTTRTFRKIWQGMTRTFTGFITQDALWDAHLVWCYSRSVRTRPSVFSLQMLYEVIICVVWNVVGSQLCLKRFNGQDKPHYLLYFKRDPCMNAANRSPAVYDVIVKNNSKDEEKSLSSWMENVQIILNTESTLCLLFVIFLCSSLLFEVILV